MSTITIGSSMFSNDFIVVVVVVVVDLVAVMRANSNRTLWLSEHAAVPKL